MDKPSINPYGQHVVGWQFEVRYQKKVVQVFPFKWVLSLNSTVGRIMIVNNWESLISNPNFVRQKSRENVLNFGIENYGSYKSKYYNYNIVLYSYMTWELYKVIIKYNGDKTLSCFFPQETI